MTRRSYIWRLIGEFLVIFIGVLLAFSVDRWWENRKMVREERFSLESIMDDLTKDTTIYNSYQIPHNREKMEGIGKLIQLLKDEGFRPDVKNMSAARFIMGISNWPVTKTSYNALKENGNLKIIRDKALRKEIINFYEAVSPNTQFANDSHLQFYTDHMLPYIIENADLKNLGNSFRILEDKEFFNLVVLLHSSIELKVKEYEKVSQNSAQIIRLIQDYLD